MTETVEEVTEVEAVVEEEVTPEVPEAVEAESAEESDDNAEEDAPEDEAAEEDTSEADAAEWGEYEDPTLAGIQDIMKDGGMNPQDVDAAFAKVLETNDFSQLDTKALEDKLGKNKAAAVIAGAKSYFDTNMAAVNATIEKIYDVLGGEDSYKVLETWAHEKEKVNPEFHSRMNEFRVMFEQGGFAAEAAAKELLNMHNSDGDTSSPNNTMTTGDNAKPIDASPLDRSDYLAQVKAAHKAGNTAEIASLQTRRLQALNSK